MIIAHVAPVTSVVLPHSHTQCLSQPADFVRLPLSQILPVFDKKLQDAGLETLREAGIEVLLSRVSRIALIAVDRSSTNID